MVILYATLKQKTKSYVAMIAVLTTNVIFGYGGQETKDAIIKRTRVFWGIVRFTRIQLIGLQRQVAIYVIRILSSNI